MQVVVSHIHNPVILSYFNFSSQAGTCALSDFGFVINHHAEQVNVPDPSVCETNTMKIPGVEGIFEVLQFHIHMSSEHSFDGKFFGAELHIVHKERDGNRLAVVGLFIMPSATESHPIFNDLLMEFDVFTDEAYLKCNKTMLPHWWQANGADNYRDDYASSRLNVYDLIPEGSTFYNYAGGLTTPPCSEIVEWNVVDTPVEITVSQFNDLSSLILNYVDGETCEFSTVADPDSGSTSRPPQDLNGRSVRRICPGQYSPVEDEVYVMVSKLESGAASHFKAMAMLAVTFVVAALSI